MTWSIQNYPRGFIQPHLTGEQQNGVSSAQINGALYAPSIFPSRLSTYGATSLVERGICSHISWILSVQSALQTCELCLSNRSRHMTIASATTLAAVKSYTPMKPSNRFYMLPYISARSWTCSVQSTPLVLLSMSTISTFSIPWTPIRSLVCSNLPWFPSAISDEQLQENYIGVLAGAWYV